MKLLHDSQLTGEFRGWDGSTVFELADGTRWQQRAAGVLQAYRYKPPVKIWQSEQDFYLQVDGMDDLLLVVPLP